MSFISGLFGRKGAAKATTRPVSGVEVDDDWNNSAAPETEESIPPLMSRKAKAAAMDLTDYEDDDSGDQPASHLTPPAADAAPSAVNIWDMDDEDDAAPEAAAPAAPAANAASSRARRNRTRLIGFDKSDGDVVDLFEDSAKAAPTNDRTQFPVGWLLVVDGPGRGYCFPLVAGMSQIGRGEDQAIALDFGDSAISRNNHAAIVFDAAERTFLLGHGGKANIVRLNGKPVISNEGIGEGDQIQIGETTLQLKVLCDDSFDWTSEDSDEEHDDVAIA